MRDTTIARERLPPVLLAPRRHAVARPARLDGLTFETLTPDSGAPTHVSCILQDKIRFMWIAAWSDLHMCDGSSFVSYKYDPSWKHRPQLCASDLRGC